MKNNNQKIEKWIPHTKAELKEIIKNMKEQPDWEEFCEAIKLLAKM